MDYTTWFRKLAMEVIWIHTPHVFSSLGYSMFTWLKTLFEKAAFSFIIFAFKWMWDQNVLNNWNLSFPFTTHPTPRLCCPFPFPSWEYPEGRSSVHLIHTAQSKVLCMVIRFFFRIVKLKNLQNFPKNLTKLVEFTLERETFPQITPLLDPNATNLKHSLGKEKKQIALWNYWENKVESFIALCV